MIIALPPVPVLLQLGAARTSSLLTAQTRMIPQLLAGIIAWDQCSAGLGGIAPVCHHRPTQRPHSYAPHEARVMIVLSGPTLCTPGRRARENSACPLRCGVHVLHITSLFRPSPKAAVNPQFKTNLNSACIVRTLYTYCLSSFDPDY